MGTSISQPSPDNSNWRRVFACYQDSNLPIKRIVNEIWKASENEATSISSMMKTKDLYNCYKIVDTAQSLEKATEMFNAALLKDINNSVVVEFAKRALSISYQYKSPSQEWKKIVFSEITKYFASRDTSGFLNNNNRNKNINELIKFKHEISNNVINVVGLGKENIKTLEDWVSFVDSSIKKLKG